MLDKRFSRLTASERLPRMFRTSHLGVTLDSLSSRQKKTAFREGGFCAIQIRGLNCESSQGPSTCVQFTFVNYDLQMVVVRLGLRFGMRRTYRPFSVA